MPAVTVAMPAYNAANTIKTSMGSALAQTFTDFELLIVDDGSQDQTKAIVELIAEGDGRVVLLSHVDNRGVGAARRTLAENARGEYVFWLDADDYMTPDALETLLAVAREKDADMVCSGELRRDRGGATRRAYCPADNLIRAIKYVIKRFAISLRPFVRTDVLRRCEFLPLNYGEDVALMVQCLVYSEEGKRVALPRFLYIYEYNSWSICNSPVNKSRNRKDLVEALEWVCVFLAERGYKELAEFAFREKLREQSRPVW